MLLQLQGVESVWMKVRCRLILMSYRPIYVATDKLGIAVYITLQTQVA